MLESDRAPLAGPVERRRWERLRGQYEWVSRVSGWPMIGRLMRRLLNWATHIAPLHPERDQSRPSFAAKYFKKQVLRGGLGRDLVDFLESQGGPLFTSFYAPAIAADYLGREDAFCLVTDSDVNRVWAPVDAKATRINYLVPTPRTRRRLMAYGVPAERIRVTGFPLPDRCVGGPDRAILRGDLARRIRRLDPSCTFRRDHGRMIEAELGHDLSGTAPPPLLTFAVGGAGAQKEIAAAFLPGLLPQIRAGAIRLCLIAGIREEVRRYFMDLLRKVDAESLLGEGIEVFHAPDIVSYFDGFDARMRETDILWTKPSELAFYAGLGIPILMAPPVGVHERYNGRWLTEHGAGIPQHRPKHTEQWLLNLLADGKLAGAAWSGFTRLPNRGLYAIADALHAL